MLRPAGLETDPSHKSEQREILKPRELRASFYIDLSAFL
jgi:hypothetical protein